MSKSLEQPKTLMDLLLELRSEVDPVLEQKVEDRARVEAWVEKNRSGLVSAMIKATRMRKMNQALYFAAILLLGGQGTWYVGRRVSIMACEDGIDDVVMDYVSRVHTNKNKTVKDVMKAVVATNLRPNWWEVDYGRNMLFGCFREKKVELSPDHDEDSLEQQMYKCLFEEKTLDSWVASSVIYVKLVDDYGWTLPKLHAWLLKNAKKHATEDWELALIDTFKRMTPDVTKFGDGNWHYNFRYMFCMGRNPHVTSYEQLEKEIEEHSGLIDKIMAIAKEKLQRNEVVIPPWAYDGMHASNKAKYGFADKRFPGTYQGFYNCIKMFDTYGRVDPRDQAVLSGCEVPPEGLVLMNEFLEDIVL